MTFSFKKKYMVELDGQTFRYADGRLSPLADTSEFLEDHYLITDLKEGLAKTMTVEAPVRYVELMVRRKLQESGEFGEPVMVITHWKKARGKNTTDVFFTALPTRLALFYTEQTEQTSNAVVTFPIYTLLYNSLKRLRSKKPVALVFQHGRSADLLVGTSKRIYYAVRCTTFDANLEQLRALWETVLTEIRTVEKEYRIKVLKMYVLDWIDSCPLPDWDESVGIQLVSLPREELLLEQEVLTTSFFAAAANLPVFQSISSLKEKLFFSAAAWTPMLTGIILTAALCLGAAGIHFSKRSHTLLNQTERLEQQYSTIRMEIPVLASSLNYLPTLDFVKDLAGNAKIPEYKQILADLAEAMSAGMTIEVLNVTYSPTELQLELFGPINAPFDQAHAGYQRFLSIVRQKGFTIVENRFDTVIDESNMQVRLVKRLT